jgi:hypothetical protein
MVQLRKPQVTAVRVSSREQQRHTSPNHIIEPCDGCQWPDRCRTDRICWAAEKHDIQAERQRRWPSRGSSWRKGGTPI